MMKFLALVLLAILMQASVGADQSPYADETGREIKSLPDARVQGFVEGQGMGYALAAELNGYPGPKHVLDLAGELRLNEEQLAQTRRLHQAMQERASALGRQLVAKERQLDRHFGSGSMTPEQLGRLVREIAGIEGEIRLVHLEAHLEQESALTVEQVARYAGLRGYGDDHHGHGH